MNDLLNSTRFFAPADGRGSGGVLRKPTARERALAAFEKAIDKDAKAEERAEAARRKAIGEVFTTFIEDADEETVIAVFAGLEVPSTKSNRRRIAAHPLRPLEVDAIVEERLAETERIKAAEAAERERLKTQEEAQKDSQKGGGTSDAA